MPPSLAAEAQLSQKEIVALREPGDAGNLDLEVCGVSPSRISHIQRAIETGTLDATVQQLLLEYKVKNCPLPRFSKQRSDQAGALSP